MSTAYRVLGRARRVAGSSDHRRILTATVLVGASTLGVKLVTMLREMLVADRLGTGDAVEAYLAAWLVPALVAMVAGDAIVGGMLPLHAKARAERGDEAGRRVFAESLMVGTILMFALTAVLAMSADLVLPLLTSNGDPAKVELAERLWLIMLPAFFVTGIGFFWSGMLNAGDRFGLAAVAPVAAPLLSGLALVLVPDRPVDALAGGFVVGSIVQLGLLGWELRRHGQRLLPRWYGGLPETRTLLRLAMPMAANAIVFGSLPLVDAAMAATLGDRQLAILSYGNRLILPIMGISSAALATVVFPYFSRLVAEENWAGLERTLRHYTRLILVASIPLTVALVVLSEPVVRTLFERGAFTADDTASVARVQAVLALMIPAYALGALYSRLLISFRKTHLLLISSVVVFGANVIGDYLLKGWLGIEGIALATVINLFLALAFIWWFCRRLLRDRLAAAQPGGGQVTA